MKIEDAAVCLQAEHELRSECETTSQLSASLPSFRSLFNQLAESGDTPTAIDSALPTAGSLQARLQLFIQKLTANLFEMLYATQGNAGQNGLSDLLQNCGNLQTGQATRAALPFTPARTIEIEWTKTVSERIEEHERTTFAAAGQVHTADGRQLDFSLELGMCRDYSCTRTSTTSERIELRDPLVINFDGNAAELSGKRFAFDLDYDSTSESLAGLAAGSGYLCIDANGDGCINDGSELFGTRSGNGFADLAKLDSDGNYWLDEADAAFDALRVWQFNGESADTSGTLASLRDQGIGALYLGETATPFTLKDDDNRTLAQIRRSGIYLNEDGRAGSLQQIDLAV
ncbi:hypothetical protein [Propionivibrio limicola]|uniref:hypothetical protein n=1 Tax=Propionivibrio limicola TaxID=167645 RepID=UPI001291BD6C|nr:hypothetical protein [Propionivibrio limicola]